LSACVDGYNAANGSDSDPEAPSSQEFDEMIARHAKIVTLH
jgi:hypothetical protein